jgi:hypothetical protein
MTACAANPGGLPGIGMDELVFGVPNFRIINAAFTYARPEGSRFNDGERGAWYCAFDADTALAEVTFHKTVEYQEIGRFDDSVSYQALLADFTVPSTTCAATKGFADCLNPASYIASQQLAAAAGRRLDGHHLPQRAQSGGTNLACFRPALVGNVRKGQAYRLTWAGSPAPTVEAI